MPRLKKVVSSGALSILLLLYYQYQPNGRRLTYLVLLVVFSAFNSACVFCSTTKTWKVQLQWVGIEEFTWEPASVILQDVPEMLLTFLRDHLSSLQRKRFILCHKKLMKMLSRNSRKHIAQLAAQLLG